MNTIVGTWWIQGEDGEWRSCYIEDDGNGNGGVRIWNEWGEYTTGIVDPNARTVETGDEVRQPIDQIVHAEFERSVRRVHRQESGR